MYTNNCTALFVGENRIRQICDLTIDWWNEGSQDAQCANVKISLYLDEKETFNLIKQHATLDILVFDCGSMENRSDGLLLLSLKNIWNVNKQVSKCIVCTPEDEKQLTVDISFRCRLIFEKLE